jgi:hypothetical protein
VAWKPIEVDDRELARFARENYRKARFLVDENLGPEVARVLRDRGFNVAFGPDVGLGGHDDGAVFQYAWRESRILLTHDGDFLDDRQFPRSTTCGVIVLPGAEGEERPMIRALAIVLNVFASTAGSWKGTKTVIRADGEIVIAGISEGRRTRRYRIQRSGPSLEWVDDG